MIEFHRSDLCVTDGDKCAKLTTAEGALFYRLWSRRGEWLGIKELLVGLDGREVPSEDPKILVSQHIFKIRRKLRTANIDLPIENQHQSFWADTKYRLRRGG